MATNRSTDRDQAREYNRNIRERKKANRKADRYRKEVSTAFIRIGTISDAERLATAQDPDRAADFNIAVQRWADECVSALKMSASFSSTLSGNINARFKRDETGLIDRVGFSFPRLGIYVHKGAGTGQGGYKGSKWEVLERRGNKLVGTGIIKHTDPDSLGKLYTGSRRPRPWFNRVIEREIGKLDKIVTDYFDTLIVDATRIYIR